MPIVGWLATLILVLILGACGGSSSSGNGADDPVVDRNIAPIADAGPDQNVSTRNMVLLDGSESSDGDADILKYSWSLASKPPDSISVLNNADSSTAAFVPDVDGDYSIQLQVDDGAEFASDEVLITASSSGSAPVANAGDDQVRIVGDTVLLDGSSSFDADGDPLTYGWSFIETPEGSTAALTGADLVNPTFVPDVAGLYKIGLAVSDSEYTSNEDIVMVTVEQLDTNVPPIADAGSDQHVLVGRLTMLDGNKSSDANGDVLTYRWEVVSNDSGGDIALSDDSSPTPTFNADLPGTIVLRLTVNDGTQNSLADTVTININDNFGGLFSGASYFVGSFSDGLWAEGSEFTFFIFNKSPYVYKIERVILLGESGIIADSEDEASLGGATFDPGELVSPTLTLTSPESGNMTIAFILTDLETLEEFGLSKTVAAQ